MSDDQMNTRRDRLARLLRDDDIDISTVESLIPQPFSDTRCAASLAQRRLWFIEQLHPGTAAHHVPVALRLQGSLDARALARAIAAIAARHEVLRTRMVAESGIPIQVVSPPPDDDDLPTIGVAPDGDAEDAYRAAAAPIARRLFDLTTDAGWRVTLLRRGAADHCLLFVFHHAMFDGSSGVPLYADLERAYCNALNGTTPLLDELPLQYGDFSVWQRVRESLGRFDRDVDYWVAALAGAPASLDFGGDRTRGAVQTFAGGVVHRGLDNAVVGRLAGIAREEGGTRFLAGFAAWSAWLRRRSGNADLVVATPSAGRTREALHGTIGMFVNTMPVRIDTSGTPTFRELVRRARATMASASVHEEAPLERVMERLRLSRELSHTPLTQTAFTFTTHLARLPSMPGVTCSRVAIDVPVVRTDLRLHIGPGPEHDTWRASLEYSSDVFSPAAAVAALDDCLATFDALSTAPDVPLPLLSGRPAAAAICGSQTNLSPVQLRMWVDQQRTPDAPLYNVAIAMTLDGPLDVAAFERAFAHLVAGHDALRLSFSDDAGVPRQRVANVTGVVEHADLSGATPEEIDAWCRTRAGEPFDLSGTLFRSVLIACGPDRHRWLFVQHHLVTDGWSVRLVYERLAQLYAEETSGERTDVEFAGFLDVAGASAEPRATRHQDADCDRAAIAPPLRFFGRLPHKSSTRVTRTALALDGIRTDRLRAASAGIARAATADHASFLLFGAALVAHLHRMTGQQRIGIGFPHHNRRAANKQVVGLFMDVLPLAIDCCGDDSFEDLIARLRSALRGSLRQARAIGCQQTRDRPCDVLLNVHTSPIPRLRGFVASTDWIHAGAEHESLAVQVYGRNEDELMLAVDTHDDVFEAAAHQAFVGQFVRVLDQLLNDPRVPIAGVRLLAPAERAAAIAAGRGRRIPDMSAETVVETIARHAQTMPDSVAIEAGERMVRYGPLVAGARRVGAALAARSVMPGEVVALCLPRSPEFVIAALGTLAAGAAYLPLDPGTPRTRLERMARQAGARLLIAAQSSDTGIGIDELLSAPEPGAITPRDGADLAYVIYTSGSTGEPHGVDIPHRALANYTAYARHAFELTPADRALQFASLTFDTAVEEIFPTLAAGATLVLRDESMLTSPATFMRRLADARVSVLNLPTAYWHTLADGAAPLPACVRLVLVGGEPMRADKLARWRRCVSSSVRILNGYGPTEATVVATFAEVGHAIGPHVAIGTPIWNVDAHVLDTYGEPVPADHAGELFIGGAGLARGYRDNPALTDKRFVPNPFGAPGDRLYRTGDLVRRDADGVLDFIGRLDTQVKVRGFRIEPAEIEHALGAHSDIADAAVVAVDADGTSALAAYLVARDEAQLDEAEVRAFLRDRLPEYMVPGDLWQIDRLPRTAHGKIDRASLATGAAVALKRSRAAVAAGSATERRLLALWTNLLGRDDIGVHDNFFDLGGHSLRATQLAARASTEFGVDVPLRTIFECQTIAAQAAVIDRLTAAQSGTIAAAAVSDLPEPAPPLSCGQERLWFLEQLTPGTNQYTMGALLRLRGRLDVSALQHALDLIAARHSALRTTFAVENGRGIQVIHPPGHVAVDRADVSSSPNAPADARRLARDLFAKPFDLSVGPLMRALLIALSGEEHYFAVTFHHAIFDGWSSAIFVEELSALYAAAVDGTAPSLAPVPADYAAFARWQRRELSGANMEALIAYWRERLAAVSEWTLPSDGPAIAGDVRGEVERVTLDTTETAEVAALASATEATPFMITAAALALVLGRLADHQDVVIGTPTAGRRLAEFERTIGCFLNTLVLRCDLSGNPTVRDLIGRMRQTALDAFAHQDLPFEQLVEALRPERSAGHQPFFDVMLNFVNTPRATPSLGGLEIATLPIGDHDAKFALTVYASIAGGRLTLTAVYRTTQFSRARVVSMLDQIAAVLRQMTGDLDLPIDDISLLTDAAAQILPSPRAVMESACGDSVTATIARVADAHPDRLALEEPGRRWTYAELSRAAGAIQRRMDAAGVPRAARVGLAGAPSGEFLAALIALWAGGYVVVPLDPGLRRERALAVCHLADVRAFLVTEPITTEWPAGAEVMAVSRGSLDMTGPSFESRAAGDAAYVCFTSGSTGPPKGVLGAHRGLSHFISWQRETFDVTPDDRVAQVTSPSFDVFFREALTPLTSGASIVVPAPIDNTTSGHTLSWLNRAAITVLHAVPAMAQSWLDAEPSVTALPSLRVVFFAGEPLTRTMVSRWRALAPHCRIVNLYGPTETTLAKCFYEVNGVPARDLVPIGRAMPGAQVLVLRGDQRCGIGEPGELVIRTPYRSLGYLRKEDQARRFAPNPFTRMDDDVVYRSGDRGRYAPDGTIDIDGRFDDAVKIRGVRVDTAEVAAALTSHSAVRHAAVLTDRDGDMTTLAAYIACDRPIAASDLRRHLLDFLPAAAVPSRFVFVRELPRGSNGKIDRAALSALSAPAPETRSLDAPMTRTEVALAAVWAEVLGTPMVNRGDDFFDAGGHSLLAARLVTRIHGLFGVELPLRALFEESTLATLAAAIDRTASVSAPRAAIPRADRQRYKASAS